MCARIVDLFLRSFAWKVDFCCSFRKNMLDLSAASRPVARGVPEKEGQTNQQVCVLVEDLDATGLWPATAQRKSPFISNHIKAQLAAAATLMSADSIQTRTLTLTASFKNAKTTR